MKSWFVFHVFLLQVMKIEENHVFQDGRSPF